LFILDNCFRIPSLTWPASSWSRARFAFLTTRRSRGTLPPRYRKSSGRLMSQLSASISRSMVTTGATDILGVHAGKRYDLQSENQLITNSRSSPARSQRPSAQPLQAGTPFFTRQRHTSLISREFGRDARDVRSHSCSKSSRGSTRRRFLACYNTPFTIGALTFVKANSRRVLCGSREYGPPHFDELLGFTASNPFYNRSRPVFIASMICSIAASTSRWPVSPHDAIPECRVRGLFLARWHS